MHIIYRRNQPASQLEQALRKLLRDEGPSFSEVFRVDLVLDVDLAYTLD
ncbi:MAG: hypothetical protein ACRCYU_23935 [Nocardioides sp.]